jgi:hypothetical protein
MNPLSIGIPLKVIPYTASANDEAAEAYPQPVAASAMTGSALAEVWTT